MSDDSIIVQNSVDFFEAVKILMPNVTVLHVSEDEITHTVNEKLPWNHVNMTKGIRDVHCISCKYGVHVQLWSHAKAVDMLVETWYIDTWNIVNINLNLHLFIFNPFYYIIYPYSKFNVKKFIIDKYW